MKHRFFTAASLSFAVAACAADPPAVAPTPKLASPPVVAKAPVAPLLQIPNAHASVDFAGVAASEWKQDFRSQGSTHVLAGSADRIVIISADHGVEGFLHPPAVGKMRWAGFSKGDAVLVLIGTTLFRSADSAAAVAGKFTPLPSAIEERFTRIASDKNILVAGAADGSAYVESTNGGATLHAAKLASKDPLVQLEVRGDGAIIAAHQIAQRPGKYGGTVIHAQIFVKSSTSSPWVKGPLAESNDAPLSLYGDAVETIAITDNQKFEVDDQEKVVALDAKRSWIRAGWAHPWLQLWPSVSFEPTAPETRPRLPVAVKSDGDADLLVGGIAGGESQCVGVECLANQAAKGPAARVQAWDDAACEASAVVTRDEEVTVGGFAGTPEKTETLHHRECDPKKPAARTAALYLPRNDFFTAPRLPRSCPSGCVTGTDVLPIIACSADYGGTAQLLSVDANGSITPLLAAIHVALKNPTAERASDGTTILSSDEQLLLCDAKARTCSALARGENFLTALPVDDGRALVFSRGADAHELAVKLATPATSTPLVRVQTAEHVIEARVTSDGNLRLWTHPTATRQYPAANWRTHPRRAQLHAWLVRTDGSLEADPNAVTKFFATDPEAGDRK